MDWKNKPQPYWKHREWYNKRNTRIYEDRESGLSWRELIEKYDLSPTRLREIYKRIKLERKDGNNQPTTKG